LTIAPRRRKIGNKERTRHNMLGASVLIQTGGLYCGTNFIPEQSACQPQHLVARTSSWGMSSALRF